MAVENPTNVNYNFYTDIYINIIVNGSPQITEINGSPEIMVTLVRVK